MTPVNLAGALASFDEVYSPRIVTRTCTRTPTSSSSSSPGGAILMFEPTGTSSTGDRHDTLPEHVDSTTGHTLG